VIAPMRTARRVILPLALATLDVLGGRAPWEPRASLVAVARAEGDWRKEFDDICAKTQDAMALGVEELRSLVARCDSLKPQLEKLDESSRKVFTRKLQACRDLYQFVLESRDEAA